MERCRETKNSIAPRSMPSRSAASPMPAPTTCGSMVGVPSREMTCSRHRNTGEGHACTIPTYQTCWSSTKLRQAQLLEVLQSKIPSMHATRQTTTNMHACTPSIREESMLSRCARNLPIPLGERLRSVQAIVPRCSHV